MPLPTQMCISASDALTGYWFIIIPALVAAVFGFSRWRRTERGKEIWDRFTLRLPNQALPLVIEHPKYEAQKVEVAPGETSRIIHLVRVAVTRRRDSPASVQRSFQ